MKALSFYSRESTVQMKKKTHLLIHLKRLDCGESKIRTRDIFLVSRMWQFGNSKFRILKKKNVTVLVSSKMDGLFWITFNFRIDNNPEQIMFLVQNLKMARN